MFLMRFGGKNDGGTPGAITFTNPTVAEEDIDMFHDDLAFVGTVVRFLAAYRRRGASIDGKFKIENGKSDASRIETVPMRLDDRDDRRADGRVDGRPDNKILGEFSDVAIVVPLMDIRANVGKWCRRMTDGAAVLFEEEDTLINVVAVIHGNVMVGRFGAPELGRNSNNEGAGGGRGSRSGGTRWRKLGSGKRRGRRSSRTGRKSSSKSRKSQRRRCERNRRNGSCARNELWNVGIVIGNVGSLRNKLWKFFFARDEMRGRHMGPGIGGIGKHGSEGERHGRMSSAGVHSTLEKTEGGIVDSSGKSRSDRSSQGKRQRGS
jgi:hypothetical protein